MPAGPKASAAFLFARPHLMLMLPGKSNLTSINKKSLVARGLATDKLHAGLWNAIIFGQ